MADFHRRDSFLRNAGTFEGFLDINSLPKIPADAFEIDYNNIPIGISYGMRHGNISTIFAYLHKCEDEKN